MKLHPSRLALSAAIAAAALGNPALADRQSHVVEARVLSAEPVVEVLTERIPRERCYDERLRVAAPSRERSATPGILGAVVGGTLGGVIGDGTGAQGLITGAGALLGGAIGRDIGRGQYRDRDRVRYVTGEVCSVDYELRDREEVTGYRVRYRIGDTIYETRTARDPGATLPVRIDVRPLP